MARYEAEIRFECPVCREGVQDEIVVPETHWLGDHADDRFAEDDADTECNSCKTVFTLHVQNSDGTIAAEVLDYGAVKVWCSSAYMTVPDLADWDDLDIPEQPGDSLSNTLTDVRQVLVAVTGSAFTSTVHRMAFIQQFAALEAYLSDMLIGQVLERPALLQKSTEKIVDLKDTKLSLSEYLADPDVVKRRVTAHLRELLYHNFSKIGSIYRATLGFGLFPDKDVQDRMFKALPLRHDCVHRNGKDKDGNERWEVNDGFVKQVEDDMRAMLRHIEAEVGKLT